jgi:hypothetical protein
MDNYCQHNPLSVILEGADALLKERTTQTGMATSSLKKP